LEAGILSERTRKVGKPKRPEITTKDILNKLKGNRRGDDISFTLKPRVGKQRGNKLVFNQHGTDDGSYYYYLTSL
jgi:hypothetical protein